jgi:hypothetical protein
MFLVVEDVLAISGGGSREWSLVLPGGRECADHDLPKLPQVVDGYALAQAFDRFVFMCGGCNNPNDCE